MKNSLFVLLIVVLFSSCTKSFKQTSSKVKILGSGAFSVGSILETKANNGMIFYGFDNNGHQFVQFIDTDSLDLTLPNGTWNFYTVAWQNASPTSLFQGTNSCGKQKGVVLNGSDTSLSLTISNSNCNDVDFSSGTSTVMGNYTLPYKFFNTCRDLSGVSSTSSSCTRAVGDSAPTRGFATYVKFFIPQYKNVGNGYEVVGTPLVSGCMEIDPDLSSGEAASSVKAGGTILSSSLSIPDINTALKYGTRIYFSKDACNDSAGFLDLPIVENQTAYAKIYTNTPTMSLATKSYVFLLTTEDMVCRDNRLTTDLNFAGGRGTKYSPYQICTPAQFNKIDSLLTDGTYYTQNKSFELLANIDFNFGTFNQVGGAMSASLTNIYAGTSTADMNLFEGNKHAISNVQILCDGHDNAGIFRASNYSIFQNLNLDKIVVDCGAQMSVGSLVGDSSFSSYKNITVGAHVNGAMYTGGLVGHLANSNVDKVFVNAIVKSSSTYSGGIAGRIYIDSVATTFSSSSFKGDVRGESGESGGIAGGIVCGYSNCLTGDRLIAKGNIVAGSGSIGGLFGNISSSGNASLSNIYFDGTVAQEGYGAFSGTMGGLFGAVQIPLPVTNAYALAQKHVDVSGASNVGGIFGSESSVGNTSCTNVYFFKDNNNYNTASTCNELTTHEKDYATLVTTMDSVATANAAIWKSTNGGMPRLLDEGVTMFAGWLNENACDGHFTQANILGNGTTASPYLICSPEQFANISSGNYYAIKRNIFLDKTSNYTPKPSGNYYIDGENHTISGANIIANTSGYSGLFSVVLPGSYLKNFTLFEPVLGVSGNYTTDLGIGFLAGYNKGLVKNIVVRQGKLDASTGFNSTLDSGSENSIGGLVGLNGNAGTISGVRFDAKVLYNFSSLNSNSASPYMGGFVGRNLGLIEDVEMNGSIYVNPQYLNSNEYVGVFAGSNEGTISSVDIETLADVAAGTSMTLSRFGIVAYGNSGLIKDVIAGSSFNFTNITGFSNSLLVNVNGGSIKRTILDAGSYVSYTPASSSELIPTTGVTESFCVHPTASGCMNSSTGQFSFASGVFSAGAYVSNSSEWNMTNFQMPDPNYTWQFFSTDEYPSLMRTGGSWGELDLGF